MYNSIYRMNPDYSQITTKDDDAIFINYKTGNWIKLNKSAVDIWNKMDGSKTLEEIIEEISNEICFPVAQVMKIYESVIKNLITSCLVVDVSDGERIMERVDLPLSLSSHPKQIWIHISDVCNLSCHYCYYKSKKIQECECTPFIDHELLFEFLGKIPKEDREEIIISGGEPFLNENLSKITKYIKRDLGFRNILLITNGTVNHEQYESVLSDIDCLQFSIDGITKEIHDKVRGEGSYDKLLKGIKTAKALKFPNIKLSFTVNDQNMDQMVKLPEFAFERGIYTIHINKMLHVGNGIHTENRFTDKDFDNKYQQLHEKLKEVNEKIYYIREVLEVGQEVKHPYVNVTNSFDLIPKVSVAGKLISCGMGIGIISIVPSGKIYPCPSLHHDCFSIGTLSDGYEKMLIAGKAMNESHNVENEKTECFSCKYKYFCGGGCRAEAYAKGDIDGKYIECDCFYEKLIDTLRIIK